MSDTTQIPPDFAKVASAGQPQPSDLSWVSNLANAASATSVRIIETYIAAEHHCPPPFQRPLSRRAGTVCPECGRRLPS